MKRNSMPIAAIERSRTVQDFASDMQNPPLERMAMSHRSQPLYDIMSAAFFAEFGW